MSAALFERRAGSGPLLVLVHGYGVSSLYFVRALRALSADFACRAPDLPGYGRSVKPRNALSVVELADVVGEEQQAHPLSELNRPLQVRAPDVAPRGDAVRIHPRAQGLGRIELLLVGTGDVLLERVDERADELQVIAQPVGNLGVHGCNTIEL